MKFLFLLLGLLATTLAIDVRLIDVPKCYGGNGWECINAKPIRCCEMPTNQYARYLGFIAVPKDWKIRFDGYVDRECGRYNAGDVFFETKGNGQASSYQDYCLDAAENIPKNAFRSSRYTFINKANEPITDPNNTTDVPEGAQPAEDACRLVNTVVLANGTKYSMDSLSEAEIVEMIKANKNGTLEAAIQTFKLPQGPGKDGILVNKTASLP